MVKHIDISDEQLKNEIKNGSHGCAGNSKLKIFGKLSCRSGKRMKKENRVFFNSEDEARHSGYRPCANCLKDKYHKWLHGSFYNINPKASDLRDQLQKKH